MVATKLLIQRVIRATPAANAPVSAARKIGRRPPTTCHTPMSLAPRTRDEPGDLE